MINPNVTLSEHGKIVVGLGPRVPASSTPDYVSLKGYHRCAVVILTTNAAAGMTGSAIAMKQATAVAGTGEKALAFGKVYANADAAASDTLVETAVTNDTFTTTNTASKDAVYVIEVDESDLDINGGFDCVRADTANATNTTVSVLYYLYPAKYGKNQPVPSAILD